MRRTMHFVGTAMLLLGLATAIVPLHAQTSPAAKHANKEEKPGDALARQVRHQLQVLPFYSPFDHIAFTLNGDKVTLIGQVLRPMLKTQAEAAVKSIEGVGTVVNQIEVLPESPTDDELRRAIYRAVFEDSVLQKYAVQAVPPIHIIVKNGNATLEGAVDSEADKQLAETKARAVANVHSLKNNLVVRAKESGSKGK